MDKPLPRVEQDIAALRKRIIGAESVVALMTPESSFTRDCLPACKVLRELQSELIQTKPTAERFEAIKSRHDDIDKLTQQVRLRYKNVSVSNLREKFLTFAGSLRDTLFNNEELSKAASEITDILGVLCFVESMTHIDETVKIFAGKAPYNVPQRAASGPSTSRPASRELKRTVSGSVVEQRIRETQRATSDFMTQQSKWKEETRQKYHSIQVMIRECQEKLQQTQAQVEERIKNLERDSGSGSSDFDFASFEKRMKDDIQRVTNEGNEFAVKIRKLEETVKRISNQGIDANRLNALKSSYDQMANALKTQKEQFRNLKSQYEDLQQKVTDSKQKQDRYQEEIDRLKKEGVVTEKERQTRQSLIEFAQAAFQYLC